MTPNNELISKPSNEYIKFIDGIRALAILLVLLFHFFPNYVVGGFIGVDIFFVVSGYLITRIITNNIKNENFYFKKFYFNRIIRLTPALLTVLIFSLLFGWIILLPLEYKELNKQVVSSGGFLSNLLFIKEIGYFDLSSIKKPLLHLWSLGVEAQFYTVWPLLLITNYKLKFNTKKLILALTALSFLCNIVLLNNYSEINFYNPISRLWEFLIGGLLSFKNLSENHTSTALKTSNLFKIVAPWLGIFCIFLAAGFIQPNSHFPGWLALFPVLGTALIIYGGIFHWLNRKLFSNNIVVWIGSISYPLYLWHWIILYFFNRVYHEDLSLKIKMLAILSSFIAAWITHKHIEKRIQSKKRKPIVFKSLAYLLGLVLLVSATGYQLNGYPDRFTKEINQLETASIDWEHPGALEKGLFEEQEYYFKNTGSSHTTLFIGDSSIEQYTPRISELINIQKSDVSNVVFFTKGACSPIPFVNANFGNTECNLQTSAIKFLKSNPQIGTVVIGGAWPIYLSDKFNYQYREKNESQVITSGSTGYYSALSSLSKLLEELKNHNVKIYLMLYIPFGKYFDPYELIERDISKYPNIFKLTNKEFCINKIKAQLNYSIAENDLSSIAISNGVEIIDPFTYLCKNGQCPILTEDQGAIYKDLGHLSASFVRKHATYIDQTVLR